MLRRMLLITFFALNLQCFLLKDEKTSKSKNSTPTTLKMLSFNVQVFGTTKMEKKPVVELLVDIFTRYDIGMMMEIRDSTNTSFWQLLDDINQKVIDSGETYSYAGVVSERSGRSSSKEQYGYIYRTDKVVFQNLWQYQDNSDIFERPPCVATFTDINNSKNTINYLAIHTSPGDAVGEMNGLVDVYNKFAKEYSEVHYMCGFEIFEKMMKEWRKYLYV